MSNEAQRLRRENAALGLMAFMRTYMKHHMKQPSGWLHDELCHKLDVALMPGGALVGALPREHAKSTFGTVGLALRAICLGMKRNIVIVCANEKEATDRLMNIKMELEENPKLRADYGAGISPKKRPSGVSLKDSLRELACANGAYMGAYTLLGKIRGRNLGGQRPDLVILDDPESDVSVESPTERRKQMSWVRSALLNSMDSETGSLVWLGTILHHDALLLNMIKQVEKEQAEGDPDAWEYIKHAALERNPDTGLLEPIWPERWSFEKLMRKKKKITSVPFEKEFMNNPVDPSTQVFKPSWWQFYKRGRILEDNGRIYLRGDDPKIPGFPLAVFTAIDPAAGTGRIHDYTAIITVGVDSRDKKIYVLDIQNLKMSGGDSIAKLRAVRDRWMPRRIGYETVAAQGQMTDVLRQNGIHVTPIKPTGSKKIRITNAAAPVESGQVVFPDGEPMTQQFIEQAEQFPSGQNDDMLDAFAQVLEIIHYSTGGSIAVIERKTNAYALTEGF